MPYVTVASLHLSDFPDILQYLVSEISASNTKAGSGKVLEWKCEFCGFHYHKSVRSRCSWGTGCTKIDCKRKRYKWAIPDVKPPIERRLVPRPSDNDDEAWSELPTELKLDRWQISNLGRLRLKRTGRIQKRKPLPDGYIQSKFYLTDEKQERKILLHRLVALTFIPNPYNYPTVNHINRNRSDNRVCNLEWSSHSEQNQAENRQISRSSMFAIQQWNKEGTEIIKVWPGGATQAVAELGLHNKSTILEACRGRYKTTCGFQWRFQPDPNLENEEWRQANVSDNYRPINISSKGRVRNEKGNASYGTLTKSGYFSKGFIWKTDARRTNDFRVHRLVAMTFLPPPDNPERVYVNVSFILPFQIVSQLLIY